MNLKKLFGGVLLLALVVGVAFPSSVLAQPAEQGGGAGEQAGGTGGGNITSVDFWVNQLLGGNNGSSGNGNTSIPGIPSINPMQILTGGEGFSISSVVDAFTGGGSGQAGDGSSVGIEGALWDVLEGFRTVFWDNNPIVNVIGDVGETIIAGGVTFLDNTFNNSGVTGEIPFDDSIYNGYNGPHGTLAPSPIPSGGWVEVTTDTKTGQSYTTIYDSAGNPVQSNDPKYKPQLSGGKNSSGPSIPGASKGTVGNPFSDGTDKNDDPSSNKEDTSNPYLFEYDPSSTNNNPAGDGAMEN